MPADGAVDQGTPVRAVTAYGEKRRLCRVLLGMHSYCQAR
jgi:hypothetical protein